ncbi:MAG: hypothetical protein KF729_38420 [Sandaracinaceae bacterium]|nr:hypothetical protein [Sandaracinaceae bacterium]
MAVPWSRWFRLALLALACSACCPRHRCDVEGVQASIEVPRDPAGLTLEVDGDGALLAELSLGDDVGEEATCTGAEPRVCASWLADAGLLILRITRTPEVRPLLPEGGTLAVRVLDADTIVAEGTGTLRFERAGGCIDQEPCPPHASLSL